MNHAPVVLGENIKNVVEKTYKFKILIWLH